jgi:hypothetical protein
MATIVALHQLDGWSHGESKNEILIMSTRLWKLGKKTIFDY